VRRPRPPGIVAHSPKKLTAIMSASTNKRSNTPLNGQRRILVTSALPNANGAIHMGHLLEHIQTDIWVRFQRLKGNECHYVCADDTHGTATMLKAQERSITPEALIKEIRDEHAADFRDFGVSHDNYYSTHSEENRGYSELIYNRLDAKGLIFTRSVEQLFDPEKELFLADRYVIGDCPICGTADQYGDNCENCSATYDATELKNPVSKLSGTTPVLKNSDHYFFDLPQYQSFLEHWTTSGTLQSEVANKLAEWLSAGLKPWDISRDAPYFGFLIPRESNRTASLHRQRHHQLSWSVLASCSRRGGLSYTHPPAHPWLHHGRRGQNGQEPRLIHQRPHLS